jgi:hypothetical protein
MHNPRAERRWKEGAPLRPRECLQVDSNPALHRPVDWDQGDLGAFTGSTPRELKGAVRGRSFHSQRMCDLVTRELVSRAGLSLRGCCPLLQSKLFLQTGPEAVSRLWCYYTQI